MKIVVVRKVQSRGGVVSPRTDGRVVVEGVVLDLDAAEVAAHAGVSPAEDVRRLRAKEVGRRQLLNECLDGAEGEDVILGWRHYVDGVCAAAWEVQS